jgi:hypothetical protein
VQRGRNVSGADYLEEEASVNRFEKRTVVWSDIRWRRFGFSAEVLRASAAKPQ